MTCPRRIGLHLIVWSVGTAATPLLAGPSLFLENAFFPSWSPDGNAIACVRGIPSWDDTDIQIWLAPRTGMPSFLLHDPEGGFWPLWLPEGQRIVYYRFWRDMDSHHEFVSIDLQGQTQATWEVPELYDDPGISLSPDGNSVLYTTRMIDGETRALDLSTGATSLVVTGSGGVISPDGQWIAYRASGSLVVGRLGEAPHLSLGDGLLGGWTKDSQYLIFSRLLGEQFDLAIVHREGSQIVPLTDDPEFEWYPRVSPTANQVVYARSPDEFGPLDVWILDFVTPPLAVEATSWTRAKLLYR